jgi:hypothetical protein
MVGTDLNLRRQQTDSILHRSSNLGYPWKVEEVEEEVFTREEKDEDDFEDDAEEDHNLLQSREQQDSGGVSGCTSVMMNNIPLKYTQKKLLREINGSGFMGQYDFLYLPMDPRSHANRGFAFINLVSEAAAEKLYKTFHGQHLRNYSAEKAIAVLPAALQGFEDNALQYATTVHRGKRTGHTKPLFLRPLPLHIAAKIPDIKPSGPQTKPAAVASHPLPKKLQCRPDLNLDDMAALLTQALLPNMLKVSTPMVAEEPPRQLSEEPLRRQPCFCVYCGKKRFAEHIFCAYCGRQFADCHD